MRWTIAVLLLLAGGCERKYAVYDQTPADTLRGECERAAYDDPVVKETLAKASGSVNYAPGAWRDQVEAAKLVAVQRCMLQRGGVRGGGGVQLPNR
jgi:hypothetical protein